MTAASRKPQTASCELWKRDVVTSSRRCGGASRQKRTTRGPRGERCSKLPASSPRIVIFHVRERCGGGPLPHAEPADKQSTPTGSAPSRESARWLLATAAEGNLLIVNRKHGHPVVIVHSRVFCAMYSVVATVMADRIPTSQKSQKNVCQAPGQSQAGPGLLSAAQPWGAREICCPKAPSAG